jgi:hypothetical protein
MAHVVEPDGHTVVAKVDKFGRSDIVDLDWMRQLGEEGGWSVLTNDHRIRRNPAEKRAFQAARLKGFFLAKGYRKRSTVERTGRILLLWPAFVDADRLLGYGSMIEVPVGPRSQLRTLH